MQVIHIDGKVPEVWGFGKDTDPLIIPFLIPLLDFVRYRRVDKSTHLAVVSLRT